jgi:hypothetical protein
MRLGLLLFVVGCAADSAPPSSNPDPDPAPDPMTDPAIVDDQSPPTSHAALVPWLAEGAYQTWSCEPEAHPARPPGAHGENRICSNDLLSQTDAGPYPVGAASVKELVRNGEVTGYAVMRKLDDNNTAGSWYWYEAFGSSVIADGRSPGICTGCHSDAPRDFIFTRVE